MRLAAKYETAEFVKGDPVQFPRKYYERYKHAPELSGQKKNVEISAFVTSWLCLGSDKNVMEAARKADELFEGSPVAYICCNLKDVSDGRDWLALATSKEKFYKNFTNADFGALCMRLHKLYREHESMEELITGDDYISPLIEYFRGVKGIPTNMAKSGCKRLLLFLRWMVRKGPVDIGIWNLDKRKLLIPLDANAHNMALELGITDRTCCNVGTAREITNKMRRIFPQDPVRGDFALYGYGKEKKR
jgi:uncharacterized protein (TIGR02757 family)